MKYIIFGILLVLQINLFSQDKIDFETDLLNGGSIQFSELYKDGVTLVNFWALWCKPCRAEMKALNQLFNDYKDDGFQVLGINLDSPRSVAKVESFVRSLKIDYKIALDPNQELFEEFNGQVVPLSVLYNKNGEVIYRHTGYLPGDEFKLEDEIKKALGDIE